MVNSMSKENNKNFLTKIFSKTPEIAEARTDESDDYTIKRNQRTDVIIRILSIIGAIIIWIYVVCTDVATYQFKDRVVELKNIQDVESLGYEVNYTELLVTFTVQGRAGKISQVTDESVRVYADLLSVDLSDIVGSQTVKVPLVYEIPRDLTCMEKSQRYLEVQITVSEEP